MTTLSQNTRVVRTKDQISCDLHGDAAVLNMKNGIYYGLNPVGSRIWSLLAQPVTLAELCRVIEAEYEAAPQKVQEDVTALMEQLLAQGLAEIHDGKNS